MNTTMVRDAVQPFVDDGTIAGAVMQVASAERVLSLDAMGFSDRSARRPMTTDALFWIASMTKPMTATALMMLVDQGKLSVDDPVEKYLPEFAGMMVVLEQRGKQLLLGPAQNPILVRDVLSHTSGMPFMSRLEEQTGRIDRYALSQAVIGYALTPLLAERMTRYTYSNIGTNICGRLIEVISGLSYETFLHRRLLDPLGMSETTFFPRRPLLERLAKTCQPDQENQHLQETQISQLSYPLGGPGRHASPAGGLFSTAADLLRFLRMILSGGIAGERRYVSADSIRAMTTTQTGTLSNTPENSQAGYGFGWSTRRIDPGDTGAALIAGCGHAGALGTNMVIEPDLDLILVLLIQNQGYPGTRGPALFPAFEAAAKELRRAQR